jgi:hypothetical protein
MVLNLIYTMVLNHYIIYYYTIIYYYIYHGIKSLPSKHMCGQVGKSDIKTIYLNYCSRKWY